MSGKTKRAVTPDSKVLFAPDLLFGVACAPGTMKRAEVEATVRAQHPCGTSGGWRLSKKRGQPCLEVPGRKHYVLDA